MYILFTVTNWNSGANPRYLKERAYYHLRTISIPKRYFVFLQIKGSVIGDPGAQEGSRESGILRAPREL